MSEVKIHPTAIVDPQAQIDLDVEIGPYAIIEADVQIASGCRIGPRAQICQGARLAKGVQVYHAASVSCEPQDLKFEEESTILTVGENTVIREFATLARGTVEAGKTVVGSNNLLMSYTHVAHDCVVGDNCIVANAVQIAGHVKIASNVIIGGMVAIHQFVNIGDHCFIGGGMQVTKDVPPFVMANDSPLRYCGLNLVGLRRRGFGKDRISNIKAYYRNFYGKNSGNSTQGIAKLSESIAADPDAALIHEFISNSSRGIIGG
jgi:UDP-N-acetylglucosamine acyltransferase